MRVIDIVTLVPQAADVMAAWGLHCSGCSMGGLESLAEGCNAHGYGDEEIQLLLEDIEEARRTAPARPASIIVTAEAACAVRQIGMQEKKLPSDTAGLSVILDGEGGFCMEFRDRCDEGDKVFINAEEPDVRVFASLLTLGRIGGATIDFREGRFKLDLPEDACSCSEQGCGCASKRKK
jgi:Fe-S cluster assembly iron-binding protein IscA